MGRIAGVTPQETRERLLDAAARVFELKGYDGATVALIAREAGVTTGAIYAHYDSKAELLVEALRHHRDRATADLFPPGARADAVELLTTLADHLPNRDESAGSLLGEALLAARRDPGVAEVLIAALGTQEAVIRDIVLDGQSDGLLSDEVSAAAAARFALMVGLGSMLVAELGLAPVDHDDWTAFTHRVVGGFTTDTDPPDTGTPHDATTDKERSP